MAQLADDLHAVLDAVAPSGPVVLVGHSMGGMTILELARTAPQLFGDRVVGVALMSTSAGEMAHVTLGLPSFAAHGLRVLAPSVIPLGRRTTQLLERSCPGATVRSLGRHPSLAPGGSEHTRGMFAVIRPNASVR